jgi:hypothetical protein
VRVREHPWPCSVRLAPARCNVEAYRGSTGPPHARHTPKRPGRATRPLIDHARQQFEHGLTRRGIRGRAQHLGDADPFMLHLYAALAEKERRLRGPLLISGNYRFSAGEQLPNGPNFTVGVYAACLLPTEPPNGSARCAREVSGDRVATAQRWRETLMSCPAQGTMLSGASTSGRAAS